MSSDSEPEEEFVSEIEICGNCKCKLEIEECESCNCHTILKQIEEHKKSMFEAIKKRNEAIKRKEILDKIRDKKDKEIAETMELFEF